MWACRALEPRHTSHLRVIVSGGAAACPNCGKCIHLWVNYITYVSSSTSSVHLLPVFFPPTRQHSSVTSRTSHVSFRAPLRSYSSFVSRFSFSRLHFPYISTRPPPNEATPILVYLFRHPEKKQVSNNVRADGTWSLCPRRVSPPPCMSMSTVVTKTIDSAYVLGLSRCLTLQTQAPCLARFERGASPRISMEFSSVCFFARCVTVSCCEIFVHACSTHDGISSHDFDFFVYFDIMFM